MYNRDGVQVLDIPRTWEELHALHRDFEAAAATGKAFKAARSAAVQQVGGAKGDGGGRPKGNGKGKEDKKKTACPFLAKGECKFGDGCHYNHQLNQNSGGQRPPKGPKAKAKSAGQDSAAQRPIKSPKGKGKGRGKGGKGKGKGKGKSRSVSRSKKSKKEQLCRHYLDHA